MGWVGYVATFQDVRLGTEFFAGGNGIFVWGSGKEKIWGTLLTLLCLS